LAMVIMDDIPNIIIDGVHIWMSTFHLSLIIHLYYN
jgi:hypothetical protein